MTNNQAVHLGAQRYSGLLSDVATTPELPGSKKTLIFLFGLFFPPYKCSQELEDEQRHKI